MLLGYTHPGPVPVIGIPGYPLAAAVIFELFAVPLLAALQGRPPADRLRQRAQLTCDWTSSPDVEDWVPVSLAPAPGEADCPVVAIPGRRGAARTQARSFDDDQLLVASSLRGAHRAALHCNQAARPALRHR